jgi:hypothetical protein
VIKLRLHSRLATMLDRLFFEERFDQSFEATDASFQFDGF